jgi:hypothetical protein
MAFDGPLLAASVVQALAALPSAIRETAALLKRPKAEPEQALARLEEVRSQLLQFSVIEAAMGETKQVHDALHLMDAELEGIRSAYSAAIADGPFNRERYDVPTIRRDWMTVRRGSLSRLLAVAASLRFIEAAPLARDTDGHPISGPAWASKFLTLQDMIDDLFRRYDRNDLHNIAPLADAFDELTSHVKSLMERADRRIIEENEALSNAIRTMAVGLHQR